MPQNRPRGIAAIRKSGWKRFFYPFSEVELLDTFAKGCELKDYLYVARGSAELTLSATMLGTL